MGVRDRSPLTDLGYRDVKNYLLIISVVYRTYFINNSNSFVSRIVRC